MDLMTGLSVWAQAQPGAANPNTIALLALRRWCGGLTLSSPRMAPSWHGLWALLAGLTVLLLMVLLAQGPVAARRRGCGGDRLHGGLVDRRPVPGLLPRQRTDRSPVADSVPRVGRAGDGA